MTDERWNLVDTLDNFGEGIHRFLHSRTCSVFRFLNFVTFVVWAIYCLSTPTGSFTTLIESNGMNMKAVSMLIAMFMFPIAIIEVLLFLMRLSERDL